MLGRLQRRPGPGAPPSAHLRFARDWSWVVAAIGVLFALQGRLTHDYEPFVLDLAAAGLVFSAAWLTLVAWGIARRERRRPWEVTRPQGADARRRALLGDWMVSVLPFPAPTVAFVVIDGLPNGLGEAALTAWMLALMRVVIAKRDPPALCLPDHDRLRLARLVKLAALVAVAGYVTVPVLAETSAFTWVPVWPGLALGWACGIASLAQLVSATREQAA
jgi:hypothetical protein